MTTAPSHVSGPVDRSQLIALARERFGLKRFRPGQLALMEAVLQGRDALGVLPTGAGKSLTYQLPSLVLEGAVLVVSPLISLMQDQQEKLDGLDIPTAKLNSTLRSSEERALSQEIREGGFDLIYVTPERLEKPDCLAMLRARGVALLVVDEAHCVSHWGHDFRPAYLALRTALQQLGRPPVLALTATATPEMIDDILQQLGIVGAEVVQTGVERANLQLRVERTPRLEQKLAFLRSFLPQQEGVGIIYTSTVRAATELHGQLLSQGIAAGLYHGRLTARERAETQQLFMADKLKVMVATNAFGLGIDKPDLRFVVHYNFPDSPESYYQEAGRAGRDGKPATVVLLYRLEDKRLHSYFLAGKYPDRSESRKLMERLTKLAGDPTRKRGVSTSELATLADVAEKRAKVIVAQLEGAGLVERRRDQLRILRGPRDDTELDQLLSQYEQRRGGDRERLQAIMHYAQSTRCRMQQLVTYFGAEDGQPCGHCDNCLLQSSRKPAQGHPPAPQALSAAAVDRLVASACGNVLTEHVLGQAALGE